MEVVGSKEVILVYGIYLDRLFFLNFGLDLLLLSAVKWTMGRTATRTRIIVSATLAAVGYCLLLLGTGSVRLKNLWGFLILSAGMTLGAFGYGNRKLFLDSILILYGYSCALGGVLWLLRRRVPALFGKHAMLVSLLVSLGLVLADRMVCIHSSRRRSRKLYRVSVELNGECWEMQGFFDSGNGLHDPIWGKPVNVLDASFSKQIQARVMPQQLLAIPFRTVGKEQGILYAARVEKLVIYGEEDSTCVSDALVAFSEREFSGEEPFQILLHPEMKAERGT